MDLANSQPPQAPGKSQFTQKVDYRDWGRANPPKVAINLIAAAHFQRRRTFPIFPARSECHRIINLSTLRVENGVDDTSHFLLFLLAAALITALLQTSLYQTAATRMSAT
jgi:hypothetical protein